jgi:hypothetical protein
MPDPILPGRVEAHEAGHAVAAAKFGIPQSVVTVAEVDQGDPMHVGGFVLTESELFIDGPVIHIRTPLPFNLPASPWKHAIFLLAGLAAEIAATRPDGIAVDPAFLQYTAADDLRLIAELLQTYSTSADAWGDLVTQTVDFVFEKWAAISKVTDVLMSEQRIAPSQVTDIAMDETMASTEPWQNRAWVIERIGQTVQMAQRTRIVSHH